MKIVRFLDTNRDVRFGVLAPTGEVLEGIGELPGTVEATDRVAHVSRLLAPIVPPTIFGIGLNYRFHAEESGAKVPAKPIVFMKASTTLQHPDAPIELPAHPAGEEVDYECELAVVISKRCKNVSPEEALGVVLGYTCANDVSARDWQIRHGGGQWTKGKTFDTFCPLGPCLVTPDELPNPNALKIATRVNGQTRQDWTTSDMIFDVPQLIAYLSLATTLLPGTVILTGTPHGVGMARKPPIWLQEGDVVEVEIEGIGVLRNPVTRERR